MLRLDARRAALASREVVQRDDRRHARLEPGASVEEALPGRRGRHERAQAQAIATLRARSEGQGVATLITCPCNSHEVGRAVSSPSPESGMLQLTIVTAVTFVLHGAGRAAVGVSRAAGPCAGADASVGLSGTLKLVVRSLR